MCLWKEKKRLMKKQVERMTQHSERKQAGEAGGDLANMGQRQVCGEGCMTRTDQQLACIRQSVWSEIPCVVCKR